ncbi:MAG: potassium transporter TrkG [Trueperaceae bacterium]|nr:potassium transporter TrkG [Trueperaceae bacterium]
MLRRRPRPATPRRPLRPARRIFAAFLGASVVGTALLAWPALHAPGVHVSFVDAAFTAVSAVTVTGLTPVPVAAFNPGGQVAILALIQVGGLGIVTLGVLGAVLLGARVGVEERLRLAAERGALHVGGVVRLARRVAAITFALEALLAVGLWAAYLPRFGPADAAWQALFHAVSAVNNAGFSTDATSLAGGLGGALPLALIAVGFVAGGLGHPVLVEGAQRLRGARRRLGLHARVVLVTSAALLAFGGLGVAVLEWTNPATLGAHPPHARLGLAAFQGATPRTAGFTAVDPADLRPATQAWTMLLMFVGGGPGSAAGGIKTTTAFVLVGSAWSLARGRGALQAFGRRVSDALLIRAFVVAFLAASLLGAAVTALLWLEPDVAPLALAFEATSAFGTVGLSVGATEVVSAPAKAVLMALMLIGRIGPLTLALALVEAPRTRRVRRPTEDVIIG